MKLKRLLSLAGILTAMLVFTGGSLYALDAVAVMNAQGFPGGTDTVDVYITTDSVYAAAQIGISFDKTKLSYVDGSLVVNSQAWSGLADATVDSANGAVNIAFYSLDPVNITLPKTTSPLKLFSIVLKVDSAAVPATLPLTPNGLFQTGVSIINETSGVTATVTAGTFTILSSYSLRADSVTASLGAQVAVPIYMTNIDNVVGAQFTLSFTSTQLEYAGMVVPDSAIWQGGSPVVDVDTSASGAVGVVLYTIGAASIAPNNEEVLLATVYLQPTADALESASNPLLLSAATITTRENVINETSPAVPLLYGGNVDIKGKFSLKVGGEPAAARGGSDTVRVYLQNAEAVVGTETTLHFKASNYTTSAANITFNTALYSGGGMSAASDVVVTDSTVAVTGYTVSGDSIAVNTGYQLLFSVIMNVKADAATGYDTLTVSGSVTRKSDVINETGGVAVTNTVPGTFLIRSPFEYQVEDVYGLPGSTKQVNILLTNRDSIVTGEFTVKIDTSKVAYVANSVEMKSGLWVSSTPTPTVEAAADSIKIGLLDLTNLDVNRMIRSGSGQVLLSLELTAKPALTNGMSSTISIQNALVGVQIRDAGGLDVEEIAATGVSGTFTVANDITPPGPVRNLTASIVSGDISLTWTNPTDADLDHITVLRRTINTGESATVFSGLATSFLDTDVEPTTTAYRYVLTAYDRVGNASDTVSTAQIGQARPPLPKPWLDFNGDGLENAGDLYWYLSHPGVQPVDSLMSLITDLLAQPVPATMLAASGTGQETALPGAAFINLGSDFETVLARFTFSYNSRYEFSKVALSPALQGKALIKPMDNNGHLIVDVISLSGFVPAEIGGDIFRVMFSNGSYSEAGLKLEKVEVGDRFGTVHTGEKAQIAATAVLPKAYALEQNSPNPFNPSTTISYEIPESNGGTRVVLTVYNIRGQKVVTLVDELKDAGRYSVNWDGRTQSGQRVSSGVYFYRLQAGDFSAVRKMVILK